MFSNYYHLGDAIELFNTQNKNLSSKWHFIGKHSKLFDPSLRCYEMILSTGNLSKMEIPENKKNAKIKTLSLFQGYVVFQLYLFTSKQLSIELAISDTTNAKRRLIFSSNNDNLVINQLHCRIPIFNFPIGKWVNLSIDILSFVSECFRNLTFRSVDYISLSMSGKVRYIFTMRTPLIDKNMEDELMDDKFEELDDCGRGDISGNSSVAYGAKDIPDKYKFPPHEEVININMNCNYVLSQFYIQNELKQLGYQQKLLLNSEPILIQDTADASNMDKGLKYRHDIYLQNKKKFRKNNKSYLDENFYENPFNNYNSISDNTNENINNSPKHYNNKFNKERKTSSDEVLQYQNEQQKQIPNDQTGRFRNIGSLIVSQGNKNQIGGGYSKVGNNNIGYGEREGEGDFINYQNNNNNRYGGYSSLKDTGGNENKFFNKEEYNKLYNNGKGLTDQINQNLNLKVNNNNNGSDIDEHVNYQLSTIKNENPNNSNNSNNINNTNNNSECVEEDKKVLMGVILEDSLNFVNQSKINAENAENNNENKENVEEKRPFSPPITKIEDGEEQDISI